MQKLRSIGFILVGAVAGVLISLNFQAIADRAARTPLPIEELRAFTEVFGAIKTNYVEPIEDTPAFKAGVKPGDLIVKLDDTPVKGMTLNDAVKRMRGKPNTQITLTITRKGESAPIIVTLTRAIIKVQSVKSKMIEPGYVWVRVSQFQEATAENMVKHIEGLFKQGQVKG